MDKQTETNCGQQNVAETKSVLKLEPPDGEWPEVNVTVSETLVVVVKREVYSADSSVSEHGNSWDSSADAEGTEISTVQVKRESPQAETGLPADTLNTAGSLTATDSSTELLADHRTTLTHPHTENTRKRVSCDFCNYQCASRSALIIHTRTHTGEKPFACNYCDYKFKLKHHLDNHIKTHTGEKPFSCKRCDYKCSRASVLKTHIRTHTDLDDETDSKAVAACSVEDVEESMLVHERQLEHEPLEGGWPEVSVILSDAMAVSDHSWHYNYAATAGADPSAVKRQPLQAEASVPADTLNTSSSQTSTDSNTELNIDHPTALMTHSENTTKPYRCNLCNYQSAHNYVLKRHMMTHTGRKPFTCKHCDYRCSQAGHLKSHLMTHTGEKPFNCKLCDYKCSRACDLKRHMIVHTGEKRFTCKHCDFKCSLACSLKSHMLTHTGEKPFSCKLCDYKCTQVSNLRIHMVTHTGEKPYSCDYCEYKCARRDRLVSHVKKHFVNK